VIQAGKLQNLSLKRRHADTAAQRALRRPVRSLALAIGSAQRGRIWPFRTIIRCAFDIRTK
jgi:hypothetical protein